MNTGQNIMPELVRHEDPEQRHGERDTLQERSRVVEQKLPRAEKLVGVSLVCPGPEGGKDRDEKQGDRERPVPDPWFDWFLHDRQNREPSWVTGRIPSIDHLDRRDTFQTVLSVFIHGRPDPLCSGFSCKGILRPFFTDRGGRPVAREQHGGLRQLQDALTNRVQVGLIERRRIGPPDGPGEQRIPYETDRVPAVLNSIADAARSMARSRHTPDSETTDGDRTSVLR